MQKWTMCVARCRLLDLKGPECSKQEKLYGTDVAGVLPCGKFPGS